MNVTFYDSDDEAPQSVVHKMMRLGRRASNSLKRRSSGPSHRRRGSDDSALTGKSIGSLTSTASTSESQEILSPVTRQNNSFQKRGGDQTSSSSGSPATSPVPSSSEFLFSSQFYHSLTELQIRAQCMQDGQKAVVYFFNESDAETTQTIDAQLAKLSLLNHHKGIKFVRVDRDKISSVLGNLLDIPHEKGTIFAFKDGEVVSRLDESDQIKEEGFVSRWFFSTGLLDVLNYLGFSQ